MTTAHGIGLPEGLRQLVRMIAGASELSTEDLAALEEQLQLAAVTNSKGTMVDTDVPLGSPRLSVADGPLAARAYVMSAASEPSGEILVWVKGGHLLGIEQAWYTDEAPAEWPLPESVRVR